MATQVRFPLGTYISVDRTMFARYRYFTVPTVPVPYGTEQVSVRYGTVPVDKYNVKFELIMLVLQPVNPLTKLLFKTVAKQPLRLAREW